MYKQFCLIHIYWEIGKEIIHRNILVSKHSGMYLIRFEANAYHLGNQTKVDNMNLYL